MAPYSRGLWQEDEHQRFLEALKRYPRGPWAEIAHYVGTRSARQVQTHAQKYYEKIERHVRGLQRDRRGGARVPAVSRAAGGLTREHEIDQEILEACSRALEQGERLPTPARPRKVDGSTRHRRAGERRHSHTQSPAGDEEEDDDDGQGKDADELDEEEEEDDEEDDEDELLPLDKSLDFLIELLAGLDDHHGGALASLAVEVQPAAHYA